MISGWIAALEASGLMLKIAVIGGMIAAAAIGYGVWHHEVYEEGVNDTIAAIARADTKMVNRALKARSVMKECKSAGRKWDQGTGNCT